MDPKAPNPVSPSPSETPSPEVPTPQAAPSSEMPSQENHSRFSKKTLILIAAVLVVIVGTIAVLFTLNSRNVSQNQNVTKNNFITPSVGSSEGKSGPGVSGFNPMVSKNEMKRVQDAYVKAYKKAGKTFDIPKTQFDYKLAPALQDNKGSFLGVKSTYADDTCNISSAPTTLPGYVLKTHYTVKDAEAVAKTYKMDTSIPASIPGQDGTSFQYFYSDPKTSAYFKLTEPSGVYTYHVGAPAVTGKNVSQTDAQTIAEKSLSDHKLMAGLNLVNASYLGTDPTFAAYLFAYSKKFDLKMVDSEAVKTLKSNDSLCNVGVAQNMNYVNALVGTSGEVGKEINQTRTVTNTYSVKRENLANSITEYKDSTTIPPVVVGSTATSGTVTVDQAVLVYFDYGEAYAQAAYVPAYLTSGTLASGARVFSIFPAVSQKDLTNAPLLPDESDKTNLQLESFNPPPPMPASKLCYGNLVDYTITCTASGQPICSGFASLDSAKYDPFGVCAKGCINKSEVFHADSGTDVCSKFMEKKGLPATINAPIKNPAGSPVFNGGDVSCTLGGCPC